MNPFTLIFLFVGVSVFFFLLVWVVISSFRICYPERPLPFGATFRVARHLRLVSGSHMRATSAPSSNLQRSLRDTLFQQRHIRSLSAREIRTSYRRRREAHARQPFQYVVGDGDTVPEQWREELWERRN